MNTNADFERNAAAWLADGPTELADRVLDAALREVHLTQQRRAVRVPWRFSLMTNTMRAAAGIAIIAVLGVGAYIFLGRGPNIGNTGPTASPSLAPTSLSSPAP